MFKTQHGDDMTNAKDQIKSILFNKSDRYPKSKNDLLTTVIEDLQICKVRTYSASNIPRMSITGNKSKSLNFNKAMISNPNFSSFLKESKIQILYSPSTKMIAMTNPRHDAPQDTLFNINKQKYNYSISIKGVLLNANADLEEVKGFYEPAIRRLSSPNREARNYIVFFLDKKMK